MQSRLVLVALVCLPAVLLAQGRRTQRPAPVPAPTAPPAGDPLAERVSYRVRVLPGEDVFEVRAEFAFLESRDTVLLSLPAWTAGSYRIENYARWVHAVRAEADGRPVFWDKLDKDTWRVAAGGARRIALELRTNPDSLDLSMSRIEPDFAFFNGTNLFVYPEGTDYRFPAEVTIETPAGWRIATGLLDRGPGRYSAADYHDLVDAPVFLGRFWMDSVQVDGRQVRFAIHPDSVMTPAVWDSLGDAIRRIVTTQNRLFGGPPYPHYTVLVYAPFQQMPWGGGLEHHNSQFDAIAGAFFAPDRAAGRLGDFTRPLLSHEFFHLFNVKRIRPAELWPYEYAREQFTPSLWWSEGVTDYYSDVTLVRSGLWTVDRFVQSVQANIATVEDAAEIVAVEDASINTWIQPTVVNESQYYYPKGSLLGLMLDIRIREATGNRASLDDVMRALYADCYQQGRGFTTQDLLGLIRRHWSGVDDFYARYINGREPLPYHEILPRAAIAVDVRETRAPWVGLGADEARGGGIVVREVVPGSTAAAAGLMPGDILLRLGDVLTTSPQLFGAQYRSRYRDAEGQPIDIVFRRHGRQETVRLPVQVRVGRTYRLRVDERAGHQARDVLEGIVGR
jgi:predicted metalloprotease with PDZ domain